MKVKLYTEDGVELAARLEEPEGSRLGYAVLAHCFTCSKDLSGLVRLSQGLRGEGYGVLRLDFMGLGESGGDFGESLFDDDVEALVAAGEWLGEHREAPRLLVGHSMGGSAAIVAAGELKSVRAVATVGAPADLYAVTRHFRDDLEEIEERGRAEVTLAGRQFEITREFLENLKAQDIPGAVRALRRPLLIMHAPGDQTVALDHATRLFQAARSQRSFLSLDGADHLLTTPGIGEYVGRLIGVWAGRF